MSLIALLLATQNLPWIAPPPPYRPPSLSSISCIYLVYHLASLRTKRIKRIYSLHCRILSIKINLFGCYSFILLDKMKIALNICYLFAKCFLFQLKIQKAPLRVLLIINIVSVVLSLFQRKNAVVILLLSHAFVFAMKQGNEVTPKRREKGRRKIIRRKMKTK